MYDRTRWVDETDQYENRYTETENSDGTITHTKVTGEVYVEGTPQNARNFNNIEDGIIDAHAAFALLLNAFRQQGWTQEEILSWISKNSGFYTGSVTLENTLEFPFNNSVSSVSIGETLENTYYDVQVQVTAVTGNAGEIEVSDKLVNGFKLSFTGSASSVTVAWVVLPKPAEL